MPILTPAQADLAKVCVDRYFYDLQRACEKDQGVPEGKPGTVGHELQLELIQLQKVLRPHA